MGPLVGCKLGVELRFHSFNIESSNCASPCFAFVDEEDVDRDNYCTVISDKAFFVAPFPIFPF